MKKAKIFKRFLRIKRPGIYKKYQEEWREYRKKYTEVKNITFENYLYIKLVLTHF